MHKKSYSERYNETAALSQEARDRLRFQRAREGKDNGVIDRVNADIADAKARARRGQQ